MKILVVGGAGYVGSTVTRQLWQQGHDVTVFDLLLFGGESLCPLLGEPRFRLVRGDIRDRSQLAEIMPDHDAVCLFAAIVGEPACNRDRDTTISTNLHGTRNVLQVAKEVGARRFVFASTCSNYGVSDPDGLVSEQGRLQPLSAYSETKVQAEEEILGAASASFHPTVMRLSTAFGISPRMRFDLLVSDFSLAAFRDRKIVIFGEQFWRPFVHVRDIASATATVLQAPLEPVSGEVFNVGCNENNTRKIDLGQLVQRHVRGTEIEFVQRDTDPRSYRVDFSKIAQRLGYQPGWNIEDGVREMCTALDHGVWRDPQDSCYYN